MRALTTADTDILASRVINPLIKVVYISEGTLAETIIPSIVSLSINSDISQFANNCTITLENVNPANPADYGYYTSHRNDTTHLKPANAWRGILVPNRRIKVYMGFTAATMVSVFYGLIDEVTINNPTLTINCRDMGKRLMDKNVNSTLTSDGSTVWGITYPIPSDITPVHLQSTDVAVDLGYVVTDICRRAEFPLADINSTLTGILLNAVEDGELKFGDNISGSPIDETWDSAINTIRDLTMFNCWCDEEGAFSFKSNILDPFVCAYTFKEGVNIFQLPLTLNQDEIYGVVRVVGDGVESKDVLVSSNYTLWDGSTLFPKKLKTISDNKLRSKADCIAMATRLATIMRENYTKINLQCIPLPHLQLNDVIKITNYGTCDDYYQVRAQQFNYDASSGLTHTISAAHYTHVD